MKVLLFGLGLLLLAVALPELDQLLLANSMIVGRQDQSDLTNWDCNVCDGTNRPLHAHYIEEKQKDVKCVLSVYPTTIVLAFRYTNTALNVWQDLLYANQVVDSNVCSNCKVQKAYKDMLGTIIAEVLADLKEIQKQTGLTRIHITGISLGGGLAVIAYIDIKNSGIFEQVDVVTFGAPRVANKNYANKFDQMTSNQTRRYIVKGDPVVIMPECFTTLLCNYKQTGVQYVCVEKDEQCTGCMNVPDGLFGRMKWRRQADPSMKKLGSIVDHITGYKKIINFTVIEC